jgi:hypothetical protein
VDITRLAQLDEEILVDKKTGDSIEPPVFFMCYFEIKTSSEY